MLSSPRVDASLDEQGQLRLQQAALVGFLVHPSCSVDAGSTHGLLQAILPPRCLSGEHCATNARDRMPVCDWLRASRAPQQQRRRAPEQGMQQLTKKRMLPAARRAASCASRRRPSLARGTCS